MRKYLCPEAVWVLISVEDIMSQSDLEKYDNVETSPDEWTNK